MMMKRAVSFVLFGLGAAILGGCPIYPADRDHRVCIGGDCYDCPDSFYSSACTAWVCNSDMDCPSGYACNSDRRCKLTDGQPPPPAGGTTCSKPTDCPSGETCGADNKCHSGDCSTSGCPSTYVCKLTGGVPACVPINGGGGTSSCKSDKDCPSPAGSKCLSGECVAPVNQCADETQCPANAKCVEGACTPACGPEKPCPTGYACDDAKGVCTNNPQPCTNSNQCNGKVCVDEHCVDPCGAGNTCAPGLVCIDGGCTPDEKPTFVCAADGPGTGCVQGSVCLRHTCYIGCDADAGTEQCKTSDKFNQCKSVTTSSGTYSVCGSSTNLGSDCDPTQGKNCAAPLVCIDGYCK